MSKEEICRGYMMLTERIADGFTNRDVPYSVQSYYLLCELVAGGSIDLFVSTYGNHRLDVKTANEGKRLMDLGNLTEFEVDVIEHLNAALG